MEYKVNKGHTVMHDGKGYGYGKKADTAGGTGRRTNKSKRDHACQTKKQGECNK